MSVGPRSEKFDKVSNDHGRTQKCDFCVSVCETKFTDHHTPVTLQYAKISSISIPSYQVMQAIAMFRLYENKPIQNVFELI